MFPSSIHQSSLLRALRLSSDSGRAGFISFHVTHVFCLCGVRQIPLAPLFSGSPLALGLVLVWNLVLVVALGLALVLVLGSAVPTGETTLPREPGLARARRADSDLIASS